jgi:hypothetical protein
MFPNNRVAKEKIIRLIFLRVWESFMGKRSISLNRRLHLSKVEWRYLVGWIYRFDIANHKLKETFEWGSNHENDYVVDIGPEAAVKQHRDHALIHDHMGGGEVVIVPKKRSGHASYRAVLYDRLVDDIDLSSGLEGRNLREHDASCCVFVPERVGKVNMRVVEMDFSLAITLEI